MLCCSANKLQSTLQEIATGIFWPGLAWNIFLQDTAVGPLPFCSNPRLPWPPARRHSARFAQGTAFPASLKRRPLCLPTVKVSSTSSSSLSASAGLVKPCNFRWLYGSRLSPSPVPVHRCPRPWHNLHETNSSLRGFFLLPRASTTQQAHLHPAQPLQKVPRHRRVESWQHLFKGPDFDHRLHLRQPDFMSITRLACLRPSKAVASKASHAAVSGKGWRGTKQRKTSNIRIWPPRLPTTDEILQGSAASSKGVSCL